jgi:putative flippase GtrA
MRSLFEQFAKFGVVGSLAFLIDYGVLMLLSQGLGMEPTLAAAISFCVSLLFNYLASMRFVFSRREDISKRREFATFAALSTIGLALNEVIMLAGTSVLGSSAMAVTEAKVAASAIVTVWNFTSRKKWLDAGDDATRTESLDD